MAMRVTSPKDQKRMASIWGVMPGCASTLRGQQSRGVRKARETKNGRKGPFARAGSSMMCSTDFVELRCSRGGLGAAPARTLAVEDKGIRREGDIRQNGRSLFVRL